MDSCSTGYHTNWKCIPGRKNILADRYIQDQLIRKYFLRGEWENAKKRSGLEAIVNESSDSKQMI